MVLTPLSEKDKSLAVAQEAYRNTNTTGGKGPISSNLDFISNQVNRVVCDEISNKSIIEESENNTEEGGFSLLKSAGDIEEAVKAVITSQILAVYRQNEEKYIQEQIDITNALWLLDSFNSDSLNKLREYIASVIKLVCENMVILNSKKYNNSKVIGTSGQLAKGWSAEFTKDFFHGDLIQKKLNEAGIKMDSEEISEWVKWRFAMDYTDPLKAISKIAEHLTFTLTDKNIQKALEKVGIKMTINEIKKFFTKRKKLSFVANNSDPIESVLRAAEHLKYTLTDKNIQEALKKDSIKMTIDQIKDIFPEEEKWFFAERYKDPLKGICKAARDLKLTLTHDNIQQSLLEAGISIVPKKIEATFHEKIRLHFAAKYKNPLKACVKYVRGEICYGSQSFCS